MRPALLLPMVLIPALALAQATSPDPAPSQMNAAEKILNTYPDWAISKAGADTTGMSTTPPANPAAAPQADVPKAPDSPASPDAPKAPPAPASPIDKLWPKDTVPIFMRACTGFHPELISPCSCVITHLMVAMPHDDFMKLSEANTLNADPRFITSRAQCLGAPGKKSE